MSEDEAVFREGRYCMACGHSMWTLIFERTSEYVWFGIHRCSKCRGTLKTTTKDLNGETNVSMVLSFDKPRSNEELISYIRYQLVHDIECAIIDSMPLDNSDIPM